MHIIYFHIVYFYQISPTCFGVLYTILRDNFVHLLKTVSLLQGYNLTVPCCLLLPCVSLPPSFISPCSMFSLTLLSQFASLSVSPSSITSIRKRVSMCNSLGSDHFENCGSILSNKNLHQYTLSHSCFIKQTGNDKFLSFWVVCLYHTYNHRNKRLFLLRHEVLPHDIHCTRSF
jgi:hypothetical protein